MIRDGSDHEAQNRYPSTSLQTSLGLEVLAGTWYALALPFSFRMSRVGMAANGARWSGLRRVLGAGVQVFAESPSPSRDE